ncbi:3-dehydro-L-gulonate 2-dehydrogenase [Mucilaginibacter gracilis]|uniref:3-dehydro-L-gulonate 2-dehydrogenase n=1 Tax=Mucilaginibacter gracilis TaxID=423350 RepID=A0A495IYX0_9SPHI|nr:3-dehydro-L-gulonate 2-dehydrogenase [Mucilaginibacter gracilis]RKR81581.1 3-dehydro-L-gulonate 2-dehydrogenase [Mucilaginibacter gracilis]
MKIPFDTLQSEFLRVLLKLNMDPAKAQQCATIFAENSRDGVYTHGLNRFPTFVELIKEGLVDMNAEPVLENHLGIIEQWNGNYAAGMLNATHCMQRAVDMAKQNGLGCVAIRNTNHWMRGGTYGWQAANQGCIGICFTNTIANVPPWGGIDPRLGNNPLIIAVPRQNGHVVLDMAVSQYSFGKLMQYQSNNQELPLPGGYDNDGKLSTNATDIIASKRILPIGFWKGSGLSLMLDLLVTILSQGRSTKAITETGKEAGVSQVFIAIHQPDTELTRQLIEQILDYAKSSRPEKEGGTISYPGENTLRTRAQNIKEGIPVDEGIWNKVLAL